MKQTTWTWDIFCHVIDNHGDLGVCWRLCADLGTRGHHVRLWVDDASALAWMAPSGSAGVEVHPWAAAAQATEVGHVVIEAFGCYLPEAVERAIAKQPRTVWLNLEYLSAEDYVPRSHGLPSPVMQGPARGATKWFFYPGFTEGTGGLLREPDLDARQQKFDTHAWRTARRGQHPWHAEERWISLFCYEPHGLPELLRTLSCAPQPTYLCVTAGRAQAAAAQACQTLAWPTQGTGHLHIIPLPYMGQTEFDQLLWACDLNFVRGEDSLVRALWAGKPLVWHIYPQDDLAHHDKLRAFYQRTNMPHSLRQVHEVWNHVTPLAPLNWPSALPSDWLSWSQACRDQLRKQTDLCTQLIGWVSQRQYHFETR